MLQTVAAIQCTASAVMRLCVPIVAFMAFPAATAPDTIPAEITSLEIGEQNDKARPFHSFLYE